METDTNSYLLLNHVLLTKAEELVKLVRKAARKRHTYAQTRMINWDLEALARACWDQAQRLPAMLDTELRLRRERRAEQ